MASSPSCSSIATNATDVQETDIFSDDSGVDVKPAHPGVGTAYPASADFNGKRNKRKSSEPKKRKDVLLMKRFRWDTDDEDMREEEEDEDVFETLERERPGSGDSGCQLDTGSVAVPERNITKKKRPWRKPKVESIKVEVQDEEVLPTFRQSVICKNETTTTTCTTPCTSSGTGTTTLLHHQHDPIVLKTRDATKDYDLILDDDSRQGSRNLPGGRPRNYKSMSRQRRIEANARERTRVHTISAAFESLRRAVPAYAHNQKLSKLAILRIASAYIVALACLNKDGEDPGPSSMSECVEQCTRTIQAEGRSRRRTSKE